MEDEEMTVAQCAKLMGCCNKIILRHIDLGNLLAQNLTPWSRKRTIKIRRADFNTFRKRLPSAASILVTKPLELRKKPNKNDETTGARPLNFLAKYEKRRGKWHEEV